VTRAGMWVDAGATRSAVSVLRTILQSSTSRVGSGAIETVIRDGVAAGRLACFGSVLSRPQTVGAPLRWSRPRRDPANGWPARPGPLPVRDARITATARSASPADALG